MGTYDTFFADAVCPSCGDAYRADFQSKAFRRLMDSIKQGEDVRKEHAEWWLCACSLFKGRVFLRPRGLLVSTRVLTGKEAERLAKRHPRILKFGSMDDERGHRWRLDAYTGMRAPNFSSIKDAEFKMYDSCPRCGVFYDVLGVIRGYVFVGVKPGSPAVLQSYDGSKKVAENR